jgi:hypothetical protein
MTVWPNSLDTISLVTRADTSVVPPGAKPTSTLIGLFGQFWAKPAEQSMKAKTPSMIFFIDLPPPEVRFRASISLR